MPVSECSLRWQMGNLEVRRPLSLASCHLSPGPHDGSGPWPHSLCGGLLGCSAWEGFRGAGAALRYGKAWALGHFDRNQLCEGDRQ